MTTKKIFIECRNFANAVRLFSKTTKIVSEKANGSAVSNKATLDVKIPGVAFFKFITGPQRNAIRGFPNDCQLISDDFFEREFLKALKENGNV